MKSEKLSTEIAALERKIKSAKNAVVKKVLEKKIETLRSELKKEEDGLSKLAKAKKKIREMSEKDFNQFIKTLSKKDGFGFLKSMTKDEIKRDIQRVAKPVGWRFRGDNTKKPTRRDIREKNDVYYEGRRNRSDVSRAVKLETGGGTHNNYEGKTPEQVWNEWTIEQRGHFISDHLGIFGDAKKGISQYRYNELPNDSAATPSLKYLKERLEQHISEGQYAKGGKMEYGGTAESSETGEFIGGENQSSMYAKGGKVGSTDSQWKKRSKMFGFKPYGSTKGKYMLQYIHEGEPQQEIYLSKEMAIDAANRYKRLYSNVMIVEPDGNKINFYAKGGSLFDEPHRTEMSGMMADGGYMAKGGSVDNYLENFDVENLDDFEKMQYDRFEKSIGKIHALKVLINNVEGDYSQLSPKLRAVARKYKMADGGYMAKGGSVDNYLENFDVENLDDFEKMQYDRFEKSIGKIHALKVLINNVEGDYSQLSPKLRAVARKYKMADGGMMPKGGGVNKYNTYKLRAEGLDDFLAFLKTGMYFKVKSFTVEPIGVPDVVVSFVTNSSLSEIKSKLKEVPDSHVMLETVKPINQYTGER